MKQYIPWLISLFCCVLVFACIVKISDLQDQMQTMQNSLNGQISSLQSNINSIYSNVDRKLEEQGNLLSDSEYNFEKADPENGTVSVACMVKPKVFQPEGTTAILTCNEEEYPMILEDKQFVATIPLSIYEQSTISSVSFEKDGTVRTQTLDWRLNPRDQFLPTMYADLHGNYTGSISGANTYVWKVNSSLSVEVEQKGGYERTVEHIDLIHCVDGVEEERIELLGRHLDEEHVSFGSSSAKVSGSNPLFLDYEIKRDFECPFGSTLELFVEMRDDSGLIHRKLVERETITADGQLDRNIEMWHGSEANIYDADGNLLYGTEWNEQEVPWQYN